MWPHFLFNQVGSGSRPRLSVPLLAQTCLLDLPISKNASVYLEKLRNRVKSNLHHQNIQQLSQPALIKASAETVAVGRAAATKCLLRALPFIPSPQSPELNYLQLAKVMPLLVHQTIIVIKIVNIVIKNVHFTDRES